MTIRFRKSMLLLFLCAGLSYSCNDKDEPDTNPEPAAIEVTSADYAPTNRVGTVVTVANLRAEQIQQPPQEGENVEWNLNSFVSASAQPRVSAQNNAIPAGSSFSSATFVRTAPSNFLPNFTLNEYYEVSSDGFFMVGVKVDAGSAELQGAVITSAGIDLPITPKQLILKFPLRYGNNNTEESKLIEKYTLDVAGFGISNAPVERTIEYVTASEVVGWGKVSLPQGAIATNTEVLLVKNTEKYTNTYYLNGELAPAPLLAALNITQGNVVEYVDYFFVSKEFGVVASVRFSTNNGTVLTPASGASYVISR
ncbi:hypothetical protein [Hugenholtzia roseola]|uniref:hypothetical protein n=1 Tax=Hugenholtzia roseola TaxID=1002 RepID=UPI00047AE00E|nr:hypothetical protein [Hugenholtzia roseola]